MRPSMESETNIPLDVRSVSLSEEHTDTNLRPNDYVETSSLYVSSDQSVSEEIVIQTYTEAVKATLKIIGPLLIDNLIFYSSGFIDGVIVGRLGTKILASSSIIGRLKDFTVVPSLTTLYILQPLISISTSKNESDCRHDVGNLVRASIVISLGFSCLIIPILLTSHYVIAKINDESHADNVKKYFEYYVISTFAQSITTILNNLLLSTGKSFAIVPLSILRTAIEIGMTALMIYGLNMGITGWGIASGTQSWIALIFSSLLFIFAKVRAYFKSYGVFDKLSLNQEFWSQIKEILTLGLPIGFQISLFLGNGLVCSILAGILGDDELASYQIASSVVFWSVMVLDPMSTLLSVLLPRLSDQESRAKLMRTVYALSAIGSITLLALPVLLYKPIVDMYSPSTDPSYKNILSTCRILIPIMSLTAPLYAAKSVVVGIMRSKKETILPLIAESVGLVFNIALSLVSVLVLKDINFLVAAQMASLFISVVTLIGTHWKMESMIDVSQQDSGGCCCGYSPTLFSTYKVLENEDGDRDVVTMTNS